MIRDYIAMAFENFRHRKVRAWLTMIGIFIGITAVVAIISLGQGLQVAINDQFNELGLDKIYVQPGSSSFGGASSVILDDSDRKVVDSTRGIIHTLGASYKSAKVNFKDEEAAVLVTGYTLDEGEELWNSMQKNNIEEGRLLQRGDTFKAFVGYDYSQDKKLWNRRANLGDKILINGVEVQIIGIQEDLGNSGDNQAVHISDDAYERIFGERIQDSYQIIIAQTAPGLDPNVVAENVKKNLRRERSRDEGDEDFVLQTTEQFMSSFNSILVIVNVVIIGIAMISLVIGGVGIMNTMYTAVVERTQEIGVMKAIGARNGDVLTIFLIESSLLGFVGGLIGVVIGLGIGKAVEVVGVLLTGSPLIRFWWSWELVAAALLFSLLVGGLSGIMPAYQASHQKPADSLRYE